MAGIDFATWPTGDRRRRALGVLLATWSLVWILHLWPDGYWAAAGVTGLMSLYIFRIFSQSAPPPPLPPTVFPSVAVIVPCRNEVLVVEALVQTLTQLNYPHLELWICDDRSTDGTGEKLLELQKDYPQIQILRRYEGAKNGKSAVLNDLFAQTTSELIAVFDADAQMDPDFLIQTVPYFQAPHVGALQVRRQVINSDTNFLTKGQSLEMLLDAYQQQQRFWSGGTAELRGSGQILRREALVSSDGWNEETITDDLDLTVRLHLLGWHIAFSAHTPIYEEAVTTVRALWKQRCRWAEGGFQRYLDYGSLLLRNGLGTKKSVDQGVFFVSQYLLPWGLIIDAYFSVTQGQIPIAGLLLNATTLTAAWGLGAGQVQFRGTAWFQAIGGVILGTVYFLHWLPVMLYTLGRMALFPKRLVWIKTARIARSP